MVEKHLPSAFKTVSDRLIEGYYKHDKATWEGAMEII
jgi:hypothetical protein